MAGVVYYELNINTPTIIRIGYFKATACYPPLPKVMRTSVAVEDVAKSFAQFKGAINLLESEFLPNTYMIQNDSFINRLLYKVAS